MAGSRKRGTEKSPAGTGLWETYSFIYSDGQLKAELTVRWTLCPEPEPDNLFRIREYARDTFCQPVIAEIYFLLYGSSCLYDGNLKGVRFRLHIEKNDELIRIIKRNADAVHDYRHPSYIRHLLGDIIMLTFFAVLANANEWGEIETFGKQKEKWLRNYLELPYGIPTDDTIRLVNSNINTEHFFETTVKLLLQTVDQILQYADKESEIHEQDILAVDGKESRGSKRKPAEGESEALRTLNVYSTDYGICLGQKFIKEKTNEIPAAQELLPLIDMKGSIVTADAMNCQKGTAAAIVAGGGEYVLALKENHPLFYEEVENTLMRTQGNA